ncbi:MAG: hypothetical protein HXM76_03570 [Mogibacterium diversum]|nr:hypothetical protein [Mogibacterium diversum]
MKLKKLSTEFDTGYVFDYEESDDGNSYVTKVSDFSGRSIELKYDDDDNLVSSSDALGRAIGYEYNEYKLPVKIINPDGTSLSLSYDDRGNLDEIIDELGNTNKYSYDDLNRVTSTVDANGNLEKFAYNARNELTESINPLGDTRTFEYNESGKLTHVIDYDGNEEFTEYNELNKVSAYVDKDGSRTEYYYNEMWQIDQIKDPTGANVLCLYDAEGNLTNVVDASYSTIRYSYDSCGNITKVRDQEGYVTKYAYDKMNRMISVVMADGSAEYYEYDAFGNETKFTDALGGEWINEYDAAGQKIKSINPMGVDTVYKYDMRGNLIEERSAGKSIRYSYDAAGRLTEIIDAAGVATSFSYDKNGNLLSRKAGDVEKSFEYDAMNRVTKEFIAGALTASYTYDAVGNISSVTDGLGNQTKYIRTKGGDIAAVVDPLGNVTRYRYDKAHRLINIVQGTGSEAEDINFELLEDAEEVQKLNKKHNSIRITSYARGVLGRVTYVTDALGNVESYEYDRKGHIKVKTDMDGNRTKIARTHLGDISRITYGDGEDIEYSYNALGQLKSIKDSLGLTKIDRDVLGRERNITDHKGRSISYEYDDAGSRTGVRYANGKNVRYIYNDRGLLTGIEASAPKMKSSSVPSSLSSSPAPASVKATTTVSLSYDSCGRIASKTVGPAETAYTYDKCGHLASLVNKKRGTVLDSYEYSYDQAGNLVASSQKREGMPEATGSYEYVYDEIGRLNRVAKDGSPLRSYTYDAFGNRTILDEAGAKTEYLYNKANQLMRADTPRGTTIFEYDKRGNAIHKRTEGASKTVSVSYTYGANNRLIQAVKSIDGKSLTARYAYNGLGMRVSRTTDAGSIDYVLDQMKMYNNLLESIQIDGQDSMSNPIESEDYTWLGNELVMAGETPILSGRLGTPERLAGASEHSFGYDEFGIPEVAKIPETTKLPEVAGELHLGFTGYMRDDISDTLFAQAREYMPEIGRFMGRDILKGRVEQPRSLNEYAYCHSDPVGFVDLNGMEEEKVSTIDYTTAMVRGGAENIGTDIADNKISSFINKWQVATINKVYKQYDHDIRVNLGRSLNNMRPGRAANALAKLESLETAKVAKVSNVGNAAKLGRFTAKRILPIGITAAGIYADYRADYNAGLSDTKIKSNMGVNAAYAATGTGVVAGGTYITGLSASALGVSGPPGWIVAGIIGAIWGGVTIATSSKVKYWINSLD